jgi:acylphosphatase
MVQAHIIYSGVVQGVGFRFTVQRYALSLDLTGWVKNLPNGSVEILVNGPEENIQELCQNIEEYFKAYIQKKDIKFTSPLIEFEDFQITF